MEALLLSGRLVDLILLFVALEAIGPWLLPKLVPALASAAPSLGDVWPGLVSGACLLIALRTALADGSWIVMAVALGGSLVTHAIDLMLRMKAKRVAQ